MDTTDLSSANEFVPLEQNDYSGYISEQDLEGIPHFIYAEEVVTTSTETCTDASVVPMVRRIPKDSNQGQFARPLTMLATWATEHPCRPATEVAENPNDGFRFPSGVHEEVVGSEQMEIHILGAVEFEVEDEHLNLKEVNTFYTSSEERQREGEEPELIDLEGDSEWNSEPAVSLGVSRGNQEYVGRNENVLHDHNFAKTLTDRLTARNNQPANCHSTESYLSIEVPSRIGLIVNSGVAGQGQEEEVVVHPDFVNSSENVTQESINLDTPVTQNSVGIASSEYRKLIPLAHGISRDELQKDQAVVVSEVSVGGSSQFILCPSLVDASKSSPIATSPPCKGSQNRRPLMPKPKPVLSSSVLNINVPGGYSVQMQRYIYANPICRVCLLAKSDMVYIFEDMDITDNGLIKNAKGPSCPSNRYNLLAAMKTLLDIDVAYGDSLPDHICIECLDKLTSFSVFRLQVGMGQRKLNSVIEQVKNTSTPTVIPPLGELDIRGVEIFRHADSIIRVRKMFQTSLFVHNVLRYIPDRVIEKMFTTFSNAVGFKSQKLHSLKAYAIDPPYANGWLCHSCGETIRGSTAEYTKHCLNVHQVKTEDVHFPCDICGEMFLIVDTSGISENYAEHWIHHFFFHKCDECDKFLPSQKGLWVHKQSAHPDTSRVLACKSCDKIFYKRSHLIAHWKTHLSPEQRKPFLNWCKICGKGLSSSLKAHMDSIHCESRVWKCEICSKQFKRKEALMNHRGSVHSDTVKFQCELCHQMLPSEYALSTHSILCKRAILAHSCHICQKRFTTASGLRAHVLSHSGVKNSEIECALSPAASTCIHCAKTFKRKEYLIEHMRIHSGETPYKCPYEDCKKEIRMKSNYLKHLRVHKKRDAGNNGADAEPVLIILEDNVAE